MQPASAEIYVLNLQSGTLVRLTDNLVEERSPSWHPDSQNIVYSCRIPTQSGNGLEICVMNTETGLRSRLTSNAVADLGPEFSPDGLRIIFQRPAGGGQQIWTMNPDGTGQTPLTFFAQDALNLFPSWGELIGLRR